MSACIINAADTKNYCLLRRGCKSTGDEIWRRVNLVSRFFSYEGNLSGRSSDRPIMTFLTWLRKTTAGKSADSMADRALTQFPFTISFEQRFNCLICWAPNLRMIYGSCQHRLCENCLYDKLGNRKVGLERCPTCQRENTFPLTKPDIPEDNVEIQAHLGVRKCPNGRCDLQMWHWEIPDHLE